DVRAGGAGSRRAGAGGPAGGVGVPVLVLKFPQLPGERRRGLVAAVEKLVDVGPGDVAAFPVVPRPCRSVAAAEDEEAPVLVLGKLVGYPQGVEAGARLHEGVEPAAIVLAAGAALLVQALDVVLAGGQGERESQRVAEGFAEEAVDGEAEIAETPGAPLQGGHGIGGSLV